MPRLNAGVGSSTSPRFAVLPVSGLSRGLERVTLMYGNDEQPPPDRLGNASQTACSLVLSKLSSVPPKSCFRVGAAKLSAYDARNNTCFIGRYRRAIFGLVLPMPP